MRLPFFGAKKAVTEQAPAAPLTLAQLAEKKLQEQPWFINARTRTENGIEHRSYFMQIDDADLSPAQRADLLTALTLVGSPGDVVRSKSQNVDFIRVAIENWGSLPNIVMAGMDAQERAAFEQDMQSAYEFKPTITADAAREEIARHQSWLFVTTQGGPAIRIGLENLNPPEIERLREAFKKLGITATAAISSRDQKPYLQVSFIADPDDRSAAILNNIITPSLLSTAANYFWQPVDNAAYYKADVKDRFMDGAEVQRAKNELISALTLLGIQHRASRGDTEVIVTKAAYEGLIQQYKAYHGPSAPSLDAPTGIASQHPAPKG